MGGRNLDDLKKLSDKMEVVFGHINEMLVPAHLIQVVSNIQNFKLD